MKLTVDSLPSHFKPYTFKSFRMDAINFDQSQKLGAKPSIEDCRAIIGELTHGEIDVAQLVPLDIKYLIASLAFHAFPKQAWTLNLNCPYCQHRHSRVLKITDFPPIPSLEEDDPYPLKVDDGTHVFELGYAKAEDVEKFTEQTPARELIRAHLVAVDGKTDEEYMLEALGSVTNFEVIGVMVKAILKYFKTDTYSEQVCPKCNKTYKVPLSAVEVTQYTPFREPEETSRYKINFRL